MLAVVSLAAQFGVFNEAFSGELWVVRHQIMPSGGATPAGVAFVNATLFVADSTNRTVIAYDNAGQIVAKPGAQWNAANPTSPVYGLLPHQLAAAVVNVNGIDTNALLISDERSNRVVAFDTAGAYLFTLRLDPTLTQNTLWQSIGMVAMLPGAKFNLTNSAQTLTLSGSFAVGRVEQEYTGEIKSAALVFQGSATTFTRVGSEFVATASAVLRSPEIAQVAPSGTNMFAVAFDTVGNLYVLDTFTERVKVYGPDFSYLFTFGTPVADGTTAEFREPWGMAFWPDATGTGGRLFIADTYNRRILIYRPVDGPDAGTVIDALKLESVIKNFVAPDPVLEVFSLAVDPFNGFIAVTDFATPRVIVMQRPALATFDVQLLNPSNGVIDSVCAGAQYKIRFSLTVPRGFAPVTGVVPQLAIDGVPTSAPAMPSAVYPSSTLSGGQVVTYTYTLAAPAGATADIRVIAGATATSTADIKMRSEVIPLAHCAAETDPSTITANPSRPPQVSGWTPMFEGETFSVRLVAQDNDGIGIIEYQLDGANSTGDAPVSTAFDGVQTDAVLVVPIAEFGRTTIGYRVRDGNQIWSPWQSLALNLKLVINRTTNENVAEVFRIGDPGLAGVTYSVTGLPAGATFSTATGQFGGVISYDAHNRYSANPAVASGEYTVVVTETAPGGATSSVTFRWTITNINRPPSMVGVADQVGMEGDAVSVQVVASDADGDPLGDWNVTGLPSGLSLSQTGLITGTLPLGSAGVYYPVHVSVTDGSQPSVVTFKWTVKKFNRAPVATGDSYVTAEDTGLTQTAPGVLGNDTDADLNPLTAMLVAGPSHGTLALHADGSFVYMPAANFNGTDAFTYKANDGSMDSAPATAVITVSAINDPPVANPDAASVIQGQSVSIAVRANDSDPDVLTTLTIVSVTAPTSGTAVINTTGTITYTAASTFTGTATFSYTISDGSLTATAVVTVTVLPINLPPICAAAATPAVVWPPNHKQVYVTVSGVTDPEGGAVTVRYTGILQDEPIDSVADGHTLQDGGIENNGARAWVRAERSGKGDGRVYLVSYTATDAALASCSGVVSVSVPHDHSGAPAVLSPGRWNSITGQQLSGFLPPDAVDDTATVKKGQAETISVLSNDIANGQALTVAIVTPPSIGFATLNANGTITYQPPAGVTGMTSFAYKVTTPGGGTDTATVTVTIKK